MVQQIGTGNAVTAGDEWATGSVAWVALKAEGVQSAAHLKRLRLEGVFSEPDEIRNVSPGQRPTWHYNIPKCRNALVAYFRRVAG